MNLPSKNGGFRVACFTRKAYNYKPGFWIPEEIKDQLDWQGDGEIGLIIFNAEGTRIFDGSFATISGGEVYLDKITQGQLVHVVLFIPA